MSAILPPDTPDDVWPVPYERRLVSRALPLRKNQVKSLHEVKVKTMKDLDVWLLRGGRLIDLPGLGPKSVVLVEDAHRALLATVEFLDEARAGA